jgi:S1-C subfamily serine protease
VATTLGAAIARSRPGRCRTLRRVNPVDLVLLGLFAVAILGGLRAGLVHRVFTWSGLIVGVVLATWTVPLALGTVEAGDPALRLFVGVLVLAVTVTVCSVLFQSVGTRARARVDATALSRVDRVAGAIAGGAAVVAIVWFLLPAAADVPGGIARAVRTSTLVGTIDRFTPPAPDASRTVRALIDQSRFPTVLSDLGPTPVMGPPPGQIPVAAEVVERATASTVNIEASGCGRRYEGSGVVLQPDIVVTNAHVVAGADDVRVRRTDGEMLDAVAVAFDADRDLAVLEVPGVNRDPLRLAPIEPNDQGVVIGYPGGQDVPRVAPVRVEQRRTAAGRDIYGQGATEREVLFLSADLQQGDSGSPVVDTEGRVTGIVFAISPDVRTTAYALDLPEVEAILAAPRSAGSTGRCIS